MSVDVSRRWHVDVLAHFGAGLLARAARSGVQRMREQRGSETWIGSSDVGSACTFRDISWGPRGGVTVAQLHGMCRKT